MSAPAVSRGDRARRRPRSTRCVWSGRISQPPEERVLPSGDVVWTFRVVVGRPAGAAGLAATVDALDCAAWCGPGPPLGVALGGRRRGGGDRGAAPPVLPVRGRRRLAGRGRGVRAAGSSVAQRADEHAQARLRLEGGRLLGQQPAAGDDAEHQVEVRGRHQDGDARDCAACAWASSTGGGSRCAAAERPAPAAGSPRAAPAPRRGRRRRQADRGPAPSRRWRRGCRAPGRPRPRPPRTCAAAPPAAAAASSSCSSVGPDEHPVDGAEEQRRVVLVDEHREAEVVGAAGVLALQAQVGGVAVVAVGDQGPGAGQRGVERGEVLRVGDRPQPVLLAGPVGVGVRRRGLEQRVHEVADVAEVPCCTSRIGAGFICISSIRSASSSACTGWMPSCGWTARSSGRVARCERSSAPTRPRTVMPPAVYSCR